jgi:hypothetical protein
VLKKIISLCFVFFVYFVFSKKSILKDVWYNEAYSPTTGSPKHIGKIKTPNVSAAANRGVLAD